MSTADQITGILPTIVAGGAAVKFTQAALGKRKSRRRKRPSKKNVPF